MNEFDDLHELRVVIDAYTVACQTGDADGLRALFHPEARMFGSFDGQRAEQPISRMLERVAETPTGEAHQCQILSIRTTGDAATVVIAEEGYLGRSFVDHFALTRHDGQWRIVSKVYHQIA